MIAFNREQSIDRETLSLAPFEDDINIYGGRDLVSGGTWMGINVATGLFVILTNYVDTYRVGQSRGILVAKFLSTSYAQNLQPSEFDSKIYKDLKNFLKEPTLFSPCNIVVYNIRTDKIYYACNEEKMEEPRTLS